MAVGLVKNKIFYSKAKGLNKAVVYVFKQVVTELMERLWHHWLMKNLMKNPQFK